LPPHDWVAASDAAFPPFNVGRFYIRGSHESGAIPPGMIGLCIDAATAFGSGEHATTEGCLLAIDDLAKRNRFKRPLDMGCGTGILAFAIARRMGQRVVAADIDPESVRVARANTKINGLNGRVRTLLSDGYANPAVSAGGSYDLIVANILARPLCEMAGDLARHLAPNGTAVLSGLLNRQEAQVLAAHRARGLRLTARIRVGVWPTLILQAGRH
jgi:ribosomal protein L11 methyltransferase